MKQLYINDKRLLLDDNTYIPFTQTISDLENVNIIGVPSSKSITIPRCLQNDEIFGYIAEITRVNIQNSDNKIGVAFNQTKKTTYRLYNESELISTGLVLIDNITDTEYNISLYDEMINKLENLSEVYLNDITELYDNDVLFEFACNNILVKNINTVFTGIKPVFNIQDTELSLDKIRCSRYTASTGLYTMEFNELPQECTPLQLKTFKTWDTPYAISINTLIDNMNHYSGALPDIIVDSSINSLLDDVCILTNKPNNDKVVAESDTISLSMASQALTCEGRIISETTSDYYEFKNGNYYIELPYHYEFQVTKTQDNILTKYWNESGTLTTYNYPQSTGQYLGSIWVKLTTFNDYSGHRYSLNPILQRIDLYNDVNCQFSLNAGVQYLMVDGTFVINQDYYVNTISLATDFEKDGHIRTEILFVNPSNSNNKINLFGSISGVTCTTVEYNNGKIEFTPLGFRSGELITASNILPKVSFKDFIITLAKTFNLSVSINSSGNFDLKPKDYYVTDDVLLIDSIEGITTTTIDFNKIILKNTLPKSTVLDNYKSKYKKDYAEQVITTGYSIKNSEKDVIFEVGVPILVKDTNAFAYDRFTKYWNSGYNKHNHGVITGFDNQLVFGYLNQIVDTMYLVDDLPAEAGINIDSYTELKAEFGQYSPFLRVNYEAIDDSSKWYWLNTTSAYGNKLTSYYTFSPYKFSGNNVTHSLEMNKSLFSYANLTDITYPDTTTLYYKYHRNMLIDKYSSNTHLLKVKVYIEGKIDIYKIYNYQNSFYIISNIVEYDPTEPGIYEVELMRVNDTNNYTTNIIL